MDINHVKEYYHTTYVVRYRQGEDKMNYNRIAIGAVLLTLLIGGAAIAINSNSSNQVTTADEAVADAIYTFPVENTKRIVVGPLGDAELAAIMADLESAKKIANDASDALGSMTIVKKKVDIRDRHGMHREIIRGWIEYDSVCGNVLEYTMPFEQGIVSAGTGNYLDCTFNVVNYAR